MADLFTLTELASFLQRDLDTSSATLARAAGQSAVRKFLRLDVDARTYTGVILPIEVVGANYAVQLPQRPVTAVTTVTVAGTTYTEGATSDGWAWDGWSQTVLLSNLTTPADDFHAGDYAVVTFDAGWSSIPDDIKGVAMAVAARQYDNPQGLRSRSVDDYSETMAGSDEALASAAGLLPSERATLREYRASAGSVRIR